MAGKPVDIDELARSLECQNPECGLARPSDITSAFIGWGISLKDVYDATLGADIRMKWAELDLAAFLMGHARSEDHYYQVLAIVQGFAHFVNDQGDNYESPQECIKHWKYLVAPNTPPDPEFAGKSTPCHKDLREFWLTLPSGTGYGKWMH